MSEIKKNEENLEKLDEKDLEEVAGGNIIDDIVEKFEKIKDIMKPTQEPVKAPLPFPQDRRP